jgi:DNA-binding transcriptional ArsR family regulator
VANKRSLTKRDFDAVVKRLNISEQAADMARRVLVGGEMQKDVAAACKLTISAVSHHVSRVWAAHVEAQEIPAGFERITAVLPTEKAEIVRTWERDSRRTR